MHGIWHWSIANSAADDGVLARRKKYLELDLERRDLVVLERVPIPREAW